MYHRTKQHAGSAEFWEDEWDGVDFAGSLAFAERYDPLRSTFEQYCRSESLFLEGGCGVGAVAAAARNRGVKVVAVDFATEALGRLHKYVPQLPVACADVSAIPMRDSSVDVYYSGGVVEHFESGPEPAIHEARRVLRPGGVLLISVPYANPLRRLSSTFRRDWVNVKAHEVTEGPSGDYAFFQYAYTPAEFKSLLLQHNFRILEDFPFSVLWGLADIPMFARLLERGLPHKSTSAAAVHAEPDGQGLSPATPAGPAQRLKEFAKQLMVSEDRTVPVLGQAVFAAGSAIANMRMYVCT
jgi:SAM-dependent methyltransferase